MIFLLFFELFKNNNFPLAHISEPMKNRHFSLCSLSIEKKWIIYLLNKFLFIIFFCLFGNFYRFREWKKVFKMRKNINFAQNQSFFLNFSYRKFFFLRKFWVVFEIVGIGKFVTGRFGKNWTYIMTSVIQSARYSRRKIFGCHGPIFFINIIFIYIYNI